MFVVTTTKAAYGPERSVIDERWEFTDGGEATAKFFDAVKTSTNPRHIYLSEIEGRTRLSLASTEVNFFPTDMVSA